MKKLGFIIAIDERRRYNGQACKEIYCLFIRKNRPYRPKEVKINEQV
jgi:hypothetical protein